MPHRRGSKDPPQGTAALVTWCSCSSLSSCTLVRAIHYGNIIAVRRRCWEVSPNRTGRHQRPATDRLRAGWNGYAAKKPARRTLNGQMRKSAHSDQEREGEARTQAMMPADGVT